MTQDIDLDALELRCDEAQAEFEGDERGLTAALILDVEPVVRELIRLAREADVLRQACAHLQEHARLGQAVDWAVVRRLTDGWYGSGADGATWDAAMAMLRDAAKLAEPR